MVFEPTIFTVGLLKQSELNGLLDRTLGETGVLRKGGNLQYSCPFCHHRKKKLEVCLNEPNPWQCWVCHTKGKGIYSFFSKIKAPPSAFTELRKIGIEKEPYYSSKKPVDEAPVLCLPSEFKSLAANDGSFEYQQAVRYAKKRNITAYDVMKYNLGYCSNGRYKDRIIFPSYDSNNQLNFFTGRSYYDDSYLKYDNCDGSKNIIGFENMVDFNYTVNLVEGPLDAIAVKRNVVPLFGTYLSKKLKSVLVIYKPNINLILDKDAINLTLEISKELLSIGMRVKLVKMEKKDAGVLGFQKVTNLIRETDYLDFASLMRLRLSS